jgi:hypothetical protein
VETNGAPGRRNENSVGDSRHKLRFRSLGRNQVTEMYPYSRLHLGKARTVAVAGPHFFVLGSEYVLLSNLSSWLAPHAGPELRTGKLEGSTTDFDEQYKAELLKAGPIRFSAVDAELEHLVTVGEDKQLKVWGLDGPRLRGQR